MVISQRVTVVLFSPSRRGQQMCPFYKGFLASGGKECPSYGAF